MSVWVDIPPAVREQAAALRSRAEGIHRVLGSFSVQPHTVAVMRKSLAQLRRDALALSKEL